LSYHRHQRLDRYHRHRPNPIVELCPDNPRVEIRANVPERYRGLVDTSAVTQVVDEGPADVTMTALTAFAERLNIALLAVHAELAARYGVELIPPTITIYGNGGIMGRIGGVDPLDPFPFRKR
jgi:hypothetical protein